MKITVVTISFNQVRFIRSCIESVLNQKDAEIEYIVVDPGSTDGSREIILEYQDKIDKIFFEPDTGPANGLNRGFSVASGDIFYYINSDDRACDGAFKLARMAFCKNPNTDVLYGNGVVIDENGDFVRNVRSTHPISRYRYACGGAVVLQQSTFIRASSFREIGGFNENNRTCWDGELVSKLLCSDASFLYLNKYLGEFRIYSGSITGSAENRTQYQNDKRRIFRESIGREQDIRDRTAKFLLTTQRKITSCFR